MSLCRRAQCRAGRRGARGDPGGVEPHLRAAGGRRGELDPGTRGSRAGHGRGIRTRARQTRESCCRTGMLGSLAPGARPCRPSAATTWGVMRPADDMRPGGGGRGPGARARTPSGASSRTARTPNTARARARKTFHATSRHTLIPRAHTCGCLTCRPRRRHAFEGEHLRTEQTCKERKAQERVSMGAAALAERVPCRAGRL